MQTIVSDEVIQDVFGKSRSDLIELIDRHTLAVQGWLSSRSPKAQVFVGKGIKASSTGLKVPLLNLALGCNFSADVSDTGIGFEIEELKKFFAGRGVPWYWWLNASPKPAHFSQIAQAHGLDYDVPPLPAMVASLGQYREFPSFPSSIQIWRAQTLEDLKMASLIRRVAFAFPAGQALSYFEDMPSDWLDNKEVKLFLAGETTEQPSAIGAVIVAEGIPGVYVMATLPDQNRRGFGKAILTRLMAEATQAGHSLIALTASKKGFGLYEQFGFHHIFSFDFYKLMYRRFQFLQLIFAFPLG